MNQKLAGNIAMTISKVCSGLNQNALRYLQPHWMDAHSGVLFRLGFASIAFWLMGLVSRKRALPVSVRQKVQMFAVGAICIYGYMLGLLLSLTYSTPISTSVIICSQPIWVLLMAHFFFREAITSRRVLGILLGFGGCLVCIFTQKSGALATNPILGDACAVMATLFYSAYIICSKGILKKVDSVTFNKWTFLGGAVSALAVVFWHGLYAPVLACGLFSKPMLALLFVLIFPSTLSYLLMAIGLEDLSATVVAIYGYLILIVSMLASYALGQDHFSWMQIAAVAMIIASVYFVEISGPEHGQAAKTAHDGKD